MNTVACFVNDIRHSIKQVLRVIKILNASVLASVFLLVRPREFMIFIAHNNIAHAKRITWHVIDGLYVYITA